MTYEKTAEGDPRFAHRQVGSVAAGLVCKTGRVFVCVCVCEEEDVARIPGWFIPIRWCPPSDVSWFMDPVNYRYMEVS